MLRRPAIVIALIAFIVGALAVLLYIAHDRIVSAPSKDAPGALFWMEVSKPILQTLLGGGIIVGLLKLLFDSVQSRRQLEAAKDQFRKDVITGFIDARYDATVWREKFLNAPSGKLEELYREMLENFIVIKEKLSRVWHDVETGKQSLTHAAEVKDNVIKMKGFFDRMLAEYRSVKDGQIPDSLDSFLELPAFGDFLSEGDHFKEFLECYRSTLRLIRLDLLGNK